MQQLPEALKALASYRQFILYKLIPSKKIPGKMDKLPVDYRTLQVFVKDDMWQDDPEAWTDATTAINLARVCGDNYGVGFFFTVNDPFYFIDIDKCANPAGGWSDTANAVMSYFPDAAVEISQSGKGLHIFGMYTGVAPEHVCKNIQLDLEMYTERRFVALTGVNIIGNAATNGDQYLQAFINNYMAPRVTATPEAWTIQPVEGCNPPDDEALIKKALASKSAAGAFGVRATFRNIWERDVEALAAVYAPDANDTGEFDESSADMALAQHLAFWTGKNCKHIERLMWLSKLVRDKWTKHKNYLRNTITRAVSLQPDESTYKGNPPKVSLEKAAPVIRESVEPGLLTGFRYLAGPQQVEHFKGCVYVQDIHKVFTPRGAFLKSDQFNATYGGYVFALDDTNRKETKKAWEAFTESQVVEYKQAETTCFNPQLPTGAFTTYDDKVAVNIYVPTNTPRVEGDPTRFLNHLAKVLPIESDRAIILAYMAACIQHKGVKFQWAPLLQGMEGNGKTLFTRCVAFAIGERFTHMPPAEQLAEKYNEWLYGTLFIGVEDIYVPDHKLNVIEVLKPMITNDRHAIRAMGIAQVMRSICCNFMFNSNHKDAVRKTRRDRRFCIFYTAQQNDGDIERDGMGEDYFPNMYEWLRGGGYAIVSNYLENYQIPDELNPATSCHRAPPTSSTDEVIEASLGGIEQEILEAIEQGRPGFAGGWISSTAVENLLKNLHSTRTMPQNKRKQMLNDMGYYWHPALKNGRVNNHIMIDAGKPKLYIKKGHISLNLKTCAEISKAYETAQGGQVVTGNAAATAFNQET
ncbi:MAG: hypothetical protein KAR42_14755 [candidate division Zixibacteria bacterium]|nr:hypothetical protein [candidate division Zixibacteria bacterium]